MKKRSISFIFLLFFTVFSFIIGDSAYVLITGVEALNSDFGVVSKSNDPECYITTDEGTTKTYYISIDSALSAASSNSTNETIVVLPGTKGNAKEYSITKKATIKSGDRLVLPLSESGIKLRDASSTSEDSSYINPMHRVTVENLKNDPFYNDDKYAVIKLTINKDIELIVNGTLDIGGYFGSHNKHAMQRPSGYTNDSMAEIILNEGSQITVSGGSAALNCYGFIKEAIDEKGNTVSSNGVVAKNNAKISTPLSIYDFGGVTDFSTLTSTKATKSDAFYTSPFDIFDFHNIAYLTLNGGSCLIGNASLSTSNPGQFYNMSINLCGNSTSYLMCYKTSFKLHIDQNKVFELNENATNCPIGKLPLSTLIFYGGGSINSINVSVKMDGVPNPIDVDTSKQFLSIPGNFSVYFNDGSYEINQSLRFLTGSKLYVPSSSTLILKSNKSLIICSKYINEDAKGSPITVYGKSIWDEGITYPEYTAYEYFFDFGTENFKKMYSYVSSSAYFELSGNFYVKGLFGGLVSPNKAANLIIDAGIKSTEEVNTDPIYALYGKTLFLEGHNGSRTNATDYEFARWLNDDKTITFFETDKTGTSGTTYIYNGSKWEKYETNTETSDVNLGSIIEAEDNKHEYVSETHTYTIKAFDGQSWFRYGNNRDAILGSENKNYVVFDLTVSACFNEKGEALGWGTDIYLRINSGGKEIRLFAGGGGSNTELVNVYDTSGNLVDKKVPSGVRQLYVVPLANYGDIKSLNINGGTYESIQVHSIKFYENYSCWNIGFNENNYYSYDTTTGLSEFKDSTYSILADSNKQSSTYLKIGSGSTIMPGSVGMNYVAFDLTITNNGGWGTTNKTDIYLAINSQDNKVRIGDDVGASYESKNVNLVSIFDEEGNSVKKCSVSGEERIFVMSLASYGDIKCLYINGGMKEYIKINSIKFYKDYPYSAVDLTSPTINGKNVSTYDAKTYPFTYTITNDSDQEPTWMHFGDLSSVIPQSIDKNYVLFDLTITNAGGWNGTSDADIYFNFNSSNYIRLGPSVGVNYERNTNLVDVYDENGDIIEKCVTSGKRQLFVVDISSYGDINTIDINGGLKEKIQIHSIKFYEEYPMANINLTSPTINSKVSNYDTSTEPFTYEITNDNSQNLTWMYFGDGSSVIPQSIGKNYALFDLTITNAGGWGGKGADIYFDFNSSEHENKIRIGTSATWEYNSNLNLVDVYDENGNIIEKCVTSGKRQLYVVDISSYGDIKTIYINGGLREKIQIHSIGFYKDYPL